MNEQTEYLYYRDLFHIFKAYTKPKLVKVLDSAIEDALQDPVATATSE